MKSRIGCCLLLAAGCLPLLRAQKPPGVSVSVYQALDRADQAVKREDYAEAMVIVREELLKDPANPYLLYNYGLAAYLAKDYKIARDAWNRLKNLEGENRAIGRDLGSLSLFQLGNADVKEGETLAAARNRSDALILYRRAVGFYEASRAMEGRGSEKAEQNLEVARARFVDLLNETATSFLDSAEQQFHQMQQSGKPLDTRQLETLIGRIRENKSFFDEAQRHDQESEAAKTGQRRADALLEQVLLADARLHRDSLRSRMEKENFKTPEEKLAQSERVLEKYDEVLAVNRENEPAREERREIANEIANDLFQSAQQDRRKADKLLEQNKQREAIPELEKAHGKLEDALTFDDTNPHILKAEQETREQLGKLQEERGDALRKLAESQPAAPERQVRALEEAVQQYDQASENLPERQEHIGAKQELARQELAAAHEKLGDQLTKSSEWMEKFMEMETGKTPDFSDKSEDQLQMELSKMERGVKEYEMSTALDPNRQSAAESREQALARLSQMRDAMNQKRLASEQAQANAQPPEGALEFQKPEDSAQQLTFENENLRDLKFSRDIFRRRNYDTQRQEVRRDW